MKGVTRVERTCGNCVMRKRDGVCTHWEAVVKKDNSACPEFVPIKGGEVFKPALTVSISPKTESATSPAPEPTVSKFDPKLLEEIVCRYNAGQTYQTMRSGLKIANSRLLEYIRYAAAQGLIEPRRRGKRSGLQSIRPKSPTSFNEVQIDLKALSDHDLRTLAQAIKDEMAERFLRGA